MTILQPWRIPFLIWNQSTAPYPVLLLLDYRFLRKQVRWSGIPISWRTSHSLLWSTQSKALAVSKADIFLELFFLWSNEVKLLSRVRFFATPWTVACQAPLSMWVAISSPRGSSPPRDWIHISCISYICRQILYHWVPPLKIMVPIPQSANSRF